MKIKDLKVKSVPCQIGLDPADQGKRNDKSFYEWIAGEDPDKSTGTFVMWLIESLAEEKSKTQINLLISDWKNSCSADEFKIRMSILNKLMPKDHPFHQIKKIKK
ncbi:MAG: hypothetical protein NUV81_00265 [bacterium]|nr:hypothetical protein [bacterium]